MLFCCFHPQEISQTVNKLSVNKQRAGANDRFHEVMEVALNLSSQNRIIIFRTCIGLKYIYKYSCHVQHFISRASDEIQELFILHTNTIEEFKSMVTYFGEDATRVTNNEIFANFAEFIGKFEVGGPPLLYNLNSIQYKKEYILNFTRGTFADPLCAFMSAESSQSEYCTQKRGPCPNPNTLSQTDVYQSNMSHRNTEIVTDPLVPIELCIYYWYSGIDVRCCIDDDIHKPLVYEAVYKDNISCVG